jgi:leucyl aminopeptidase
MKFPAVLKVAGMSAALLAGQVAAQDLPNDPVARSAAARAEDPLAPVYLVSSRDTYSKAIQAIPHQASSRRDGAGRSLVLSQIKQYQLPIVTEAIHRVENRCGGFFAFDSLARAEHFIRSDKTAQAMRATPLAYTIDNQATVDPWLPQVAESAIAATMDQLSAYRNRYYASSHGLAAAQSIRDRWQALANGRSDVTTTLFTACTNCSTQPSVILTIAGSDLADEIVVLGAHLDSINAGGGGNEQVAPGADDDASGIATLTEVLRVALAGDWKPRRTVMFMGYAAEEVGLRGSNAIASAFRDGERNVVGVLQLDMTNYKLGTGVDMQLITDYSNAGMKQFLGDLFDAYLAPLGLTRGRYTCGYGCSDHASWASAGYPSAMMFEAGDENGDYFPYIHSADDTMANMGNSAANSAKFAKLGLAFLGELGKTVLPDGGDTDGGALANGVAVDGIGKVDGSITFHIAVPARSTKLTFTISGGTGNADLYIKRGGVPTDVVFDCRPLKPGNDETCGLLVPRAGTYYVKLKANPSFDGVTLKAGYRAH